MEQFKDRQQVLVQEQEGFIAETVAKVNAQTELLNEIIMELDNAESEKNMEVSNFQKEITKLQDDIETINDKLKQVQN